MRVVAAVACEGMRASSRLFAVVLAAFVAAAALAGVARAEGSAQLYPANATCQQNSAGGSCRANIEWRTSSYGPATGAQVRRRTFLQVYAAAGEVLVMGSSAVGVGAGDILVYEPGVVTDSNAQPLPIITTGTNGFRCSDQRTASGVPAQGRITSRALELAGAQAVSGGGNPTGYVPCSFVAPATGLYGVVFYGPDGDGGDTDGGVSGQINLTSASNFDASQRTSVAAWDISVRTNATSTTDLAGRVFTKALVAYTGGNPRPINVSVNVVTSDGFRYRTDTRGLDPNGFAFYGNEFGFLDGDGTTPLYHDAYGTTNTGQLTGLAGGVTFAAPAFPIFFGSPATATLSALGIPLTPVAPTISTLSFSGNVGGSTSSIGVGGTFSYTAGTPGVYEIVISRDGVSFDPAAPQNRVLRGARAAGAQAVVWDGKDNSGADFPVGANYALKATLHAGEYHFPLIDAENSTLGGPTFTLLNPPGGVCPLGGLCTAAFFDDRGYRTLGPSAATVGAAPPPDAPLCGAGPPPAPYHSDPVTGFDTSGGGRAFGSDSGGNTNTPCTGSFGDVKGLDMWTFFPSTTAASALSVVSSADLSITKAHSGSFTVGQAAAYTITVSNAGGSASDAVTVTDALPPGLAFSSGTGSGWLCSAVGQTVTCTNAAGIANGSSSALTLNVTVGPPAAPTTTNTASVSAVVFDPNPANNSASDPTAVVPVPLAVADAATTGVGTPVTIAVLGNDGLGVGPTTITAHTAPTSGVVTCTTTDCTYTPNAGYTGLDAFNYTITDTNGRTSTATVTIIVSAPPAPSPSPAPTPTPGEADLETAVAGPATASPGARVSLVAIVRNNGPASAPGNVTLTVPVGFTPDQSSITIGGATAGNACTVSGRTISCSVGPLASGASVAIAWRATIAPSAASGSYIVRATVTSAVTDPVPANNPSAWTIQVPAAKVPSAVKPARLGIVAESNRKTVSAGGVVTTKGIVRNLGPGAAVGVLVCTAAPPGMTFVSAPGAVFRSGRACWTIRRLAPGTARGVTVTFRVDRTQEPGTIPIRYRATSVTTRKTVAALVDVRILVTRSAGRPGGVTG